MKPLVSTNVDKVVHNVSCNPTCRLISQCQRWAGPRTTPHSGQTSIAGEPYVTSNTLI